MAEDYRRVLSLSTPFALEDGWCDVPGCVPAVTADRLLSVVLTRLLA